MAWHFLNTSDDICSMHAVSVAETNTIMHNLGLCMVSGVYTTTTTFTCSVSVALN
jgi:hypothetical protein